MTRHSWRLLTRPIVVALGVAALVLIVVTIRSEPPQAVASAVPVSSASHAKESVRVQHDFVSVTLPASEGVPVRARAAVQLAGSTQRAAARLKPAPREPGMIGKARRAFLGDGRHRPEPFPRVRPQ